ncbi:MAG: hypothetical protein E7346_04960 [Clostridiales bacterium]|nr:hypothetical protein [Clostridiales bacterium]
MIEALLNYQTADAKLRKIEKTLSESEERKKAVNAKKYLEGVEDNVNKLDDRAAELIATYQKATEDQLKLKEIESEIEESIDSASDPKEVSFLIKKAEELISKIKALGAKASKISEEIQAVMKEYSTIKNTTKAAQVQYKENAEKYNALKESVKAEKESVEKELEELKAKVDPTLMDRYLKKRANKIYPIVYAARDNVCGACNMELPMSELNRLKNGEIIDCDQCGRLIYQPKK